MANEKQQIPKARILSDDNSYGLRDKNYTNSTKYSILRIKVDDSTSVARTSKKGAKNIFLREDLIPGALRIKDFLNIHKIPFTCNENDINLLNNNLSYFGKAGLEIQLNENSGLSINSNYEYDDFFIGPDYSQRISDYYKLKVYGHVRNLYNTNITKYKLIVEPTDIYDIKDTYNSRPPKIIKIFKPLIDVTEIFKDQGYIQPLPEKDFFLKSNNLKSNWNIFYNTKKIKIGDSYRELLEQVYKINNRLDPLEEKLMWDGEKFK